MSDIHIYLEREQPVKVITLEPTGARGPVGPQGPAGAAGPNSVTSATTSDATCELSLESLQVGQNSVVTGSAAAAIGECTASSSYDFAAGYQNTASGGASIALGSGSTASGVVSFANGGACVASADFSHAAGFRAKAIHNGASVESDSQDADVESLTTDEKTFRFANGYRFLGGSATFEGTVLANHIHGNLAGSVYAHVRAGEALLKGDPVYISGSHGTAPNLIPIVSKADASNSAKMPAIGIMDADLANNANGHMVITGTIADLNTAAYAVNDTLYVASGGGLTATPPTANSQPVARVERSNANNGALIVKVNGLASNGGNGVSDANKLVRFSSTGTIPVASIGGLGTGVATALAVNTGSAGAFVVNGGTATNMTFAGTAAFTSTTRPTSAGTGTPAATSLITLNDWAEEQIWNMYRLPKTSTPAITQNGATTALNSSDGIALRIESANTAPRPVAAFNRIINRNPAVGNQNVVTPMRVATMVAMGVGNENHRIRFFIGGANGTLPPYANEQPISGRGWGWELFYSATNARHEIALFAHDGTTFVRTDGLSGRSNPIAGPTSINQICSMIIGINASGLVSLWANIPTSDGRATRPSATPVLTLAGGPTSGNYGTFGGICCSAVAQSTGTAGAITDIRFESPTIILD